ncbi:glycoprotein-N-acetylgalactosamine 3-beta-galactosyltransferase 1-like [Diadema antillarum]|uniref:glycoprotein-N-acetylgalactosamine 3-beta-galactosyltransferase 1-like n=1 Tax=Diadema antillarum TaxID=105358 RepID=UPI003A8699E6
MEIRNIMSLALGLVAGVMFGIVYSKYEDYSTFHDVRIQSVAQQHVEGNRRDNIRGLLRFHGNNATVGKKESLAASKPLEYAVGGKSFYLKFDSLDSMPSKSEADLQKDLQLATIAEWQTFDPLHDADMLKSLLSVFCVVPIGTSSVPQHGKAAAQSWTKHCNDYIMLSSVDNELYKVKNIGVADKHVSPWERTKRVLAYALEHHPNHDWYVKVEHDTFLVLENFRYMILAHRTGVPGFAGHVIQTNDAHGSVIALSKFGLSKAVTVFPNCNGLFGGQEDYKELEACLKQAGIKASTDARDGQGVNQFQMVQAKPNLPLNAHKTVDWSWRSIVNPENVGQEDCCRDYPVSFHKVSPNGLYMMEYAVYHMRPFGIGTYMCPALQDGGVGDQVAAPIPPKEQQAEGEKVSVEGGDNTQDEQADTALRVEVNSGQKV